MEFKIGDRVLVKPSWTRNWVTGIVRSRCSLFVHIKLDHFEYYDGENGTHSFNLRQILHNTKLSRILEGIDTTQQNE